jgi:predicted lipoprotein with Yx(FWY)xxD motif
MRRLIATAIAAVVVAAALAAVAAAATNPSTAATVKVHSTKLGKILVDTKGRTLYVFTKDKKGHSACSGACAKAWVPMLTKGTPKVAGGATMTKVTTTKRSDGTTQVVYAGHPLYTFAFNKTPSATTGQGNTAFGGRWWVIGTNGKPITKT